MKKRPTIAIIGEGVNSRVIFNSFILLKDYSRDNIFLTNRSVFFEKCPDSKNVEIDEPEIDLDLFEYIIVFGDQKMMPELLDLLSVEDLSHSVTIIPVTHFNVKNGTKLDARYYDEPTLIPEKLRDKIGTGIHLEKLWNTA